MKGGDLGYSCEEPAYLHSNKEIVKRHRKEYNDNIYKEIEEKGESDPEDVAMKLSYKYDDEYHKIWEKYMRNCLRGEELASYLFSYGSDKEQKEYSKYFDDDYNYIGPKDLSLKNKNKKYGGNITNNMSAEQQRFREIYRQKALDGDYAGGLGIGGLHIGGAKGVPKRCPKGEYKVCKGGIAIGGAAKGSHCAKGQMKLQKSGVKRCAKYTKPAPKRKMHLDRREEEYVVVKEKKEKQHRRPSMWVEFLKDYASANGISYAEALQHAKKGPDGVSALKPLYLGWLGEEAEQAIEMRRR